jgi:DNA modification methylase
MIPQIAGRLIRERSSLGNTVLDPFCGSGSVLVEALLLGRNALGVDINPLAHLIAKVKITPIDPVELDLESHKLLESVKTKLELAKTGKHKVQAPYFTNIFHWFNRNVIEELSIVKEQIETSYPNGKLRDFFNVCFSMTIRKTSNIAFDDNPYFIRAMTKEDLRNHAPDVFASFEKQIVGGVERMKEFHRLCPKEVKARVFLADSRSIPLEDGSVDLIVTSPPYGEESHTMSYSRFSKLSLLWMGMSSSELNRYSRKTLGGQIVFPRPYSDLLDASMKEVSKKSKARAREMFSFFWDYAKCLQEMFRVMKSGGHCCVVIGDRSVAGVAVSNGELTKQLGELYGFKHVQTYQREIPKKVLPRRDYKVELINRENIIILRKT